MEDADRVNVTMKKDLEFFTGITVDGPRNGTLTVTLTFAKEGIRVEPDSLHRRPGLFSLLAFESLS